MLEDGLLPSRWEKSELGPKRRVYTLSEKGLRERRGILLEAIETVHEFYGEYLAGLPPRV